MSVWNENIDFNSNPGQWSLDNIVPSSFWVRLFQSTERQILRLEKMQTWVNFSFMGVLDLEYFQQLIIVEKVNPGYLSEYNLVFQFYTFSWRSSIMFIVDSLRVYLGIRTSILKILNFWVRNDEGVELLKMLYFPFLREFQLIQVWYSCERCATDKNDSEHSSWNPSKGTRKWKN